MDSHGQKSVYGLLELGVRLLKHGSSNMSSNESQTAMSDPNKYTFSGSPSAELSIATKNRPKPEVRSSSDCDCRSKLSFPGLRLPGKRNRSPLATLVADISCLEV